MKFYSIINFFYKIQSKIAILVHLIGFTAIKDKQKKTIKQKKNKLTQQRKK